MLVRFDPWREFDRMAQTLLFQSDEYRDKVNAFGKRREKPS